MWGRATEQVGAEQTAAMIADRRDTPKTVGAANGVLRAWAENAAATTGDIARGAVTGAA